MNNKYEKTENGIKIRQARMDAKLSREELSVVTGVPSTTIRGWELGKCNVPDYITKWLIRDIKEFMLREE